MSKEKVIAALRRLQKTSGDQAVKAVLTKHGADKISDLEATGYSAVIAEAKSYGRAHALLSPSAANRWTVCHAYPQAAALTPNTSSPLLLKVLLLTLWRQDVLVSYVIQ